VESALGQGTKLTVIIPSEGTLAKVLFATFARILVTLA